MNTEHLLAAVAEAVADGRPVDWDSAESSAASDEERAAIRGLRRVRDVVQLHRTLASQADSSPCATAGGRVLPFTPERVAATPSDTAEPRHWGHFPLLEMVGEGVYGEVFRAWDPLLDREIALKLLRSHEPADVASAIVREGRLLARVRHPNVVSVFGAECVDGSVGLWMEFIRGRTLEALLRDRGPLGPDEATLVGLDLCRALAAVHAAGLVHRDVKAQNVMREDGGRVVLMDFGTGHDVVDAARREPPGVAGTPLYLAPELLRGTPASAQTDIYGLGVLLYHLVTNGYPLATRTMAGVRQALFDGTRTRLRDARPDLPVHFVRVVERALAPDPRDRFESAGAMEAALDDARYLDRDPQGWAAAAGTQAAEGARKTSARRTTRQTWLWNTTILALAVAVVALVLTWPRWWSRGPVLPFASRDWVLVAAFDNRTGEMVLDGSLEFALQRELANSQFVNVVPPERVYDTMRLMRQEPTAVLKASLAREVCLRDGDIRALVTGRVDTFAGTYTLSVQVAEPAGGRVVASLAEIAESQAGLMPAVRRVSDRIRRLLGEQREAISSGAGQLAQVTTPSLEALHLYTQAVRVRAPGDWRAAAELAAAAIARDPGFASAEVWLGWSLANSGRETDPAATSPWSGRGAEAAPHFKRAFDLADSVSERERLFILGSYYLLGAPDLQKAIASYEALLRLYPDDYWGVNNLALAYANGGRPAADYFRLQVRRTELRPDYFEPYLAAVEGGLAAGADRPTLRRLVEKGLALAPADLAADPAPNQTAYLRTMAAFEMWADDDGRAAGAMLDELRNQLPPGGPARKAMQRQLAAQYLALGRVREAEDLYRSDGSNQAVGGWRQASDLAAVALARGDRQGFRRQVRLMYERAGGDFAGDRGDGLRTWFLVRAGMVREAEQVAARAREANAWDVSTVLGEVAAMQGDVAAAVTHLHASFNGTPIFGSGLFGSWWRCHETMADALASSGDLAAAARDLETAVSLAKNANPQTGSHGYWCLRLRMKLADLYRKAGRSADAEVIERGLLGLLVRADQDFAIAARLRARYPGAVHPR